VRRYEYWYRWDRLTGGIGDANRHTSADSGARGAGAKRGHDGDDPGRGVE
jgi:hypothetical protein